MEHAGLARRLGLSDAVFVGVSSMLGAGVFAVFAPAAAVAGSDLLFGLAIAAAVAWCNASSSAQLAAVYPTSGGTYVYGREQLGPWWGFTAGWAFLIGKTASCAAMALTFAAYAVPVAWQRPVAAIAVLALAGVNYLGVTRTAQAARAGVILVLACLAVVVAAGLTQAGGLSRLVTPGTSHGWYGLAQSAGLMFFAFAGYARVATLGEEVRDPAHTIPRAILLALGIVVMVYALVATVALGVLGADGLAGSLAPLADVVVTRGWGWAVPVVGVGAALASSGALLALMAGIGRTTLAMARERDLPVWLDAVHSRWRTPHRAEVVLALAVTTLVLTVDLRGAIGFSSFGVLLYYAVANLAAFTQPAAQRRTPRSVQAVGCLGCLALTATLPPGAMVSGLAVLTLGAGYRIVTRRPAR
ncbi:MAG: APC family permease [Propionicimonas sp.]